MCLILVQKPADIAYVHNFVVGPFDSRKFSFLLKKWMVVLSDFQPSLGS